VSVDSEPWRPWGRQGGGVREALVAALFALVTLGVAGGVGLATKQPWLFPSLGPTAILFFASPADRSARPVNAIVGHFVAIVVGYLAFLGFGLAGSQPAPIAGLTPAYVGAGAVSVAVTLLVLHLVRLPHAPAGATTLIVSLGILATPIALLVMAGAIVLVVAVAWGLNRLAGRWRTT
jgi:hypothetical protein